MAILEANRGHDLGFDPNPILTVHRLLDFARTCALSHEPKPLATSPPSGTFLAKLQNFKKFVGFSGLLDIIR